MVGPNARNISAGQGIEKSWSLYAKSLVMERPRGANPFSERINPTFVWMNCLVWKLYAWTAVKRLDGVEVEISYCLSVVTLYQPPQLLAGLRA